MPTQEGSRLPLVTAPADPVYAALRSRQASGEGVGSLLYEYPFAYSTATFLADISGELDRIINGLIGIGVAAGCLQALHIRLD